MNCSGECLRLINQIFSHGETPIGSIKFCESTARAIVTRLQIEAPQNLPPYASRRLSSHLRHVHIGTLVHGANVAVEFLSAQGQCPGAASNLVYQRCLADSSRSCYGDFVR